MQPQIKSFFHHDTSTFSYVVFDPDTNIAAVIDPVLDFDQASGRVNYQSVQSLMDYVAERQLTVAWILETHAHADHLTAAQYVKKQTNAKVVIGKGITSVQQTFKKRFNLASSFACNGEQFDLRVADGDEITLGSLTIAVMATPGHTNDSVSYLIADAIFVGDTLFPPAVGTARCDFPGGDASTLYHSIQKIFSLPQQTRIFMCHDYPENGRKPICQVTVAEQRQHNIHVNDALNEQDFVKLRQSRDKTLAAPRLIFPAIQVNIRAGHFPEPEDDQQIFLKIPISFPE